MKSKSFLIILLAIITLNITSCSKEPDYAEQLYKSYNANTHGDDTKIDIKGSMTNGDMKRPNLAARLDGNILSIFFFEAVENCMVLITAENNDLLFSRRMSKQPIAVVQVFMGGEPTGDYHLYITNGFAAAEGDFHFVQQLNDNNP